MHTVFYIDCKLKNLYIIKNVRIYARSIEKSKEEKDIYIYIT